MKRRREGGWLWVWEGGGKDNGGGEEKTFNYRTVLITKCCMNLVWMLNKPNVKWHFESKARENEKRDNIRWQRSILLNVIRYYAYIRKISFFLIEMNIRRWSLGYALKCLRKKGGSRWSKCGKFLLILKFGP